MPRQNRVTPLGEIISVPERGMWMGNRGNLHNTDGEIRRSWRLKAWITCRLDFKGWHREVMSPGKYTELFFLDEATALAAGHRPCAECRRADYRRFKSIWLESNRDLLGDRKPEPSIKKIDEIIHRQRIAPDGAKLTFLRDIAKIPDGVMIQLKDQGSVFLVWRSELFAWSPSGYTLYSMKPAAGKARVITPRSVFKCIANGYVPQVHFSVG